MLGLTGVIAIDCSTAAVVTIRTEPEIPFIEAVIVESPAEMPVTTPERVTAE